MGKRRVIAETGAGQHGVATATACALMGLDCVVYMGEEDTRRQALNVARMHLLGAEVIPVRTGSRTLKDAINEAMRDWVDQRRGHPLPARHGGRPAPVPDHGPGVPADRRRRGQAAGARPDRAAAGRGVRLRRRRVQRDRDLPCVRPDEGVRLYGYEAGGDGVSTGRHASSISGGAPGVLHGARSYLLQDEDGQTVASHSISAGLGLPRRGPGARVPARLRAGDVRAGDRRRGDGRVPARWPAPRASSRRSSPRTRWPARSGSPATSGRTPRS